MVAFSSLDPTETVGEPRRRATTSQRECDAERDRRGGVGKVVIDPAGAPDQPSRHRCTSVRKPPGMRNNPAVVSMAGPVGSEKTNDR